MVARYTNSQLSYFAETTENSIYLSKKVIVLNPYKCFFMLLGAYVELQAALVCGNDALKNSKQENVSGVTVLLTINLALRQI